MANKIKRIDIKEFRERGYLQEVNRQFFHPLGLALEVIINKETGQESLGGVWDYREDPEGIYFALNEPNHGKHDLVEALKKKQRVEEEFKARTPARIKALGFFVEPVPGSGEL